MLDEYALIRQLQESFGLGAKPFFWFFNTLWGLGLSQLLLAIIFWLGSGPTRTVNNPNNRTLF